MKKQSNQLIIIIAAFLVGIFAASLFSKDGGDESMIMDTSMDKVTEESAETGSAESTAPAAAATSSAPANSAPKTNSAYSGGNCVPGLSAKKDSTYNAILVNWTPCSNLQEFQFYKLVRSETNSNPSYPGDYVAFSSSNKDAANYIDKTVARARTYHYRMCVVQRLNKVTCSNSVTVSY